MSDTQQPPTEHVEPAVERIVSAQRVVNALPAVIFELIADPARQPEWDGNDYLQQAEAGQRVHRVGDVFTMLNTSGKVRANHIVEFVEGYLIAWRPSEVDAEPPGHLWRWELTPITELTTLVVHTYDWTALSDERRFERARATTTASLQASIDRLATLAEAADQPEAQG